MLTIQGLVLGYGGEPVLDGVDLSVDAGRIVALVGPSGSGKSSILRTVTGLQELLAGRITLGVDHAEFGMLFQDDALLPWRSVRDNVALGLRVRGWGACAASCRSGGVVAPGGPYRAWRAISRTAQWRPTQASGAGTGVGAEAASVADG